MFRRKTLVAVAAAVALSLAVTACGGSDSPTNPTEPGKGGTLTLGVIAPASTFSAADFFWANESPYGQAVYDTLLRANPKGEIEPGLATKWEYNADKTVLTLTLRNDVTFTDGEKFNADGAAKNVLRFRDGASPNKSNLVQVSDAKAVNDTTLQITLKDSDPAMLTWLTRNSGQMQSPKSFNNPDIKTNPVGSGPYILDTGKTVVGSSYTFNKNPNYWDKATQHYETLVLKVFNDPTAMLNAVRGKQLNGAKLANNETLDQVKGAGYTVTPFELDWSGMMLSDRAGTVNPALKEVKVRQAINHAFDRAALLTAVAKGRGTVTTQVFPFGSEAYDPALDSRYPFDPAKAKSLLAEAGYPNGFTLDMPRSAAVGTAMWTLLAQQLKDVGITVNYTDVGTQYFSDILAKKYAANWFQLQQDTPWQVITFEITSTSVWNNFKYNDSQAEKLAQQYHDAVENSDPNAGAIAKELNKYIVEQAWFAPWFRIESNYATDANTNVAAQRGNAYPYLSSFTPKS